MCAPSRERSELPPMLTIVMSWLPLVVKLLLTAGMCAVAGAFATRKLRQARPAEIF